jgi:hypothetical protein
MCEEIDMVRWQTKLDRTKAGVRLPPGGSARPWLGAAGNGGIGRTPQSSVLSARSTASGELAHTAKYPRVLRPELA